MFYVLVLVGIALHGYVWLRLVRDTTGPGSRARRIGTGLLLFLVLILVVTLFRGRAMGVGVGRWFAWPAYLWAGLLLYLLVFLALLELPRFLLLRRARRGPRTTSNEEQPAGSPEPAKSPQPVDESRRLFVARTAAVIAGAASVGVVGYGMTSALGDPLVKRVPIPLRGLHPDLTGFRIAVVSDIHLGPLLGRSHTERIVRMVNETEPDLVAIVGDLVDGTVGELGPAAAPLRDLASRNGTFFVTGNHEYYSGYQEWIGELSRLGVHPLRNERTTISHGAGTFDLAGINDVAGKSRQDGPDLARALSGRDPANPVVLLAHQPVQVCDAVARGVDLQLSGHTHGGQIYPFHHVIQLAQPSLAGLSRIDETWLYVTRGVGFFGPPVRVGAPPDISVVELRPDEARPDQAVGSGS